MDYWGAKAVWYSSGPDGFGQWYAPPDSSTGEGDFSYPPSKDGSTGPTIDQIHQELTNSQPAHLVALGDQWQNMYNLLDAVRTQLLTESTTLYDEKWKDGKAREAFMTAGPGQALAYLDAWMDSAVSNLVALGQIASIVSDYQARIVPLWQEYQQAVKDAQNVKFGDKAYAFFWDYNLIGGGNQPDYDRQTGMDKINQIDTVHNKYNLKAQQLAYAMAGEMFQTFTTFSAGHGPLYEAPDAVIDPPMLPMTPNVSVPGGVPSVGPLPPIPPLPSLPPVAPPMPTAPAPPPVLTTPMPPTAPTAPVAPTAPAAPTAPTVPVIAPVVAPVLDVGAVAAPARAVSVEAPAVPDAATSPFQAPRVANSNGLISRASANLSEGTSLPASALTRGVRNLGRSAAGAEEPPPSARAAGRRGGDESSLQREPATDDLFGAKGMSTPAVLGNQRRGRSRSALPPAVSSDELGAGLPGRANAVPPILAKTRRAVPKSGPTAGIAASTAATDADLLPPSLLSSALRAPHAPVTGDEVSGLEEVPAALRAPVGPGALRTAAARAVTGRGTDRKLRPQHRDERVEADAPPSAEEAFSVETPGGGVLGGRTDAPTREAEPRAQVRAG